MTLSSVGGAKAQTGSQTDKQTGDKQKAQAGAATPSPLAGVAEATLIDGQPALRILTRGHGSAEIRYEKRDGEDALVFPVMHWHAILYAQGPGEMGRLYVTKTKLVYEPESDKGHFFNVARADLKKARYEKSGRFGKNIGSHINIDSKKGGGRFAVVYNDNKVVGFQGDYMKPVLEFFDRAIADFDAALAEFNQLTASVRPAPEEEEAEDEAEEAAEISTRYDRFKDVTVVRTSRMRLSGGRRSLRVFADLSYPGKTPRQPEKVNLSFYASAVRPVFREEELELNFLVDGERVPVGTMRITDEDKTKSLVKQTVSVALPYETFAKIARGKKVELQVGNLEYKLTDAHLESFRKLLEDAAKPPAEKDEQ
jgi:hypothetical protein